tara:strand:+ start:6962 stop:7906 length:945 start_codon:yes stop_codon:yes gene_type:complete
MKHSVAVLVAMLPPIIWGSTYLVTTELLPPDKPLMAAVLRILPIGIVVTLITGYKPTREQWSKLFLISLLVMSLFHWPLFVSAYRLPGGFAALLVTSQPLLVVVIGFVLFGARITLRVGIGIVVGLAGVVLVLIVPSGLHWDTIGIIAAFTAAVCMSLGTLLTKRWQMDIPVLAFTGWQLLIGGAILLPFALVFEMPMSTLEASHIGGYFYLAVGGTLLPYFLWMSALRYLEPVIISTLLLLSPLSATVLGYVVLDQALTNFQIAGAVTVLIGILIASVSPSKLAFWRAKSTGTNEEVFTPGTTHGKLREDVQK